MDHVVYLDHKAKELENLKNGTKTMIMRAAMGRKLPYGRVNTSDALFFIENKGDGLVKGKAMVAAVFNSEQVTKEESLNILVENQNKLCLNSALKKRFGGKRYVVLITIKNFEIIEPFKIDKSEYGNMDDWLPVEDIRNVML